VAIVEYELKDRVAYVTLNRPEKLNAINLKMRDGLMEALSAFDKNEGAWVCVVQGAGRAFSVGLDLAETSDSLDDPSFAESIEELYLFLSSIPKPTVAVINGYCLAQGGGIALACDVRIAGDRAVFGWPQAKRGISSISGPAMLAAKVPLNFALEYLYTGELIDAQAAYRLNLVNRVVPNAELEGTVSELLGKIAANAPLPLSLMKQAAVSGQGEPLEARVNRASKFFQRTLRTDDAREGLAAFIEKRTPLFRGR